MPLQLTRKGLVPFAPPELQALRHEFARRHCARLPRLLEPDLLRRLQARLASDAWTANVHHLVNGESTELVCAGDVTVGLLVALFNDSALFRAIQDLTDCDPIASFQGRIYRMDPGAHRDVWHTDANGNYMVALSLNLGTDPFRGGELHLRECGSRRVLVEVANTGTGDAIIFRIDGTLEHIVTPVAGDTPKLAWAGWFQRKPLLPALDRLAGR